MPLGDDTPQIGDISVELFAEEISNESPYGTAIVGLDGRLHYINAYLCHMLGYSASELLGTNFLEVTYEEDLKAELPYLARLSSGGIDHYRFKKRYRHKDGHILWGMLDRTVARDAERKPLYFITRIRDITTEKDAEPKPSLISMLRA